MSFKMDDDESASKTVNLLKAVAKPSRLGPHADRAMGKALEKDPRILRAITTMIAETAYKDAIKWRRSYCLTPHVRSTLMWSH